ncbi:hypothetical protein MKX03_020579, partial [Papaver bracteatum]
HSDPCCMLCSADIKETTMQLFVDCCFTRAVWFGLGIHMHLYNNNSFEWVKSWFSSPMKEWKEMFAIICWHLWKYRNMVKKLYSCGFFFNSNTGEFGIGLILWIDERISDIK